MNPLYTLRLFWRNLLRRKIFSLINAIGLAFGIAFIILIGQYLYHEYSYNRFLKNIDNIYRVVDAGNNSYWIDYRARDAIADNIPAVKNACLFDNMGIEINYNNQVYEFDAMVKCDAIFFDIFNFPFVYGNPTDALKSVEGIVLTESTANLIFGNTDPIGQRLMLDHQNEMVVTGIVRDLSENLSFKADMFVSAENVPQHRLRHAMDCRTYDGKDDSECKYPFSVFIELQDQANASEVAAKIPGLFNSDDYRFPDKVNLVPLKSNYFNTQYWGDRGFLHGNLALVEILFWVGLVILALAVINFINLTTASYRHRLTEIGIKKCFGVSKRNLQNQLLFETFLFCVCSAFLGVVIAEIFLPYFNQYVDKPLQIQLFTDLNFTMLFLLFIILLSVFAGFIPAFILAKISPLQVFQFGSFIQGSGKTYRHVLSVFQFGVTIALICSLLVMSKQIDYVKHKDVGFDTEQLIHLKIHYRMGSKTKVLTDKLRQYHGMKSITATNGIPGGINMTMDGFKTILVDSASIKTFGFKIIQGRDLLPGDLNKACLINIEGLKKFDNNEYQGNKVNGSEIVGVVSDFHYNSMHNHTEALALVYYDWDPNSITMRIAGPVKDAVVYIKNAWQEICPDFPFDLQFYDDDFAAMYHKEENLATLISIFSVLAVVISCMGILGLAVFQSEQKIKEIGIRKVLGATTTELTAMLTKNFIGWVLIANILGWPVAYFAMNKWLQNFAYRIDMGLGTFVLAGSIALVIALITVSVQVIRAAIANPVESLRYE